MSGNTKASWWLLYLMVGFFIVLCVLQQQLPVADIVHRLIEIGLVLIMYSQVHRWLKANEHGLLAESRRKYPSSIHNRTTIESRARSRIQD